MTSIPKKNQQPNNRFYVFGEEKELEVMFFSARKQHADKDHKPFLYKSP